MEYIIKSNSYRLLKKELDKLTKNIDKENINYFDLDVDSIKDILDNANYVSLFDDKKGIIVYNSNIFGTKFEYKNELEILEKYLNNPNDNTTLIFLTDNISKSKKCVKLINSKGNVIELNKPTGDNLKKEIINYLKDFNFKIENLCNRLENKISLGKIKVILEAMNELGLIEIYEGIKETKIKYIKTTEKVDLQSSQIIKKLREVL